MGESKLSKDVEPENEGEAPKPRRVRKYLVWAVVLPFALLVIVAMLVLGGPILFVLSGGTQLPAPDGAYGVGRVVWDIVDEDREEIFTEQEDDFRRIRADVYYPTTKHLRDEIEMVAYLDPEYAEMITGIPSVITNLIGTNTASIRQKPPAREEGPFPVLLFSPGADGPPTFYMSLFEHLVSRGYIVVALWHTYTGNVTLFPDGDVVEWNFLGNDSMWEGTDEERDVAKQRVTGEWAKDTVSVLNEIERRNDDDGTVTEFMQGVFDLDRVGAFGHSFGGQNAAAAMTMDDRILAGLNMDGTSTYQPIMDDGVRGSFAFVYDEFEPPYEYLEKDGITVDEWWADWSVRNFPQAVRDNAKRLEVFQVKGLKHEGFGTDLTLLKPLVPFVITDDMVGTVDGHELLSLLTDVIDAFFDRELSGAVDGTLDAVIERHHALHRGIVGHPDFEQSE